MYCNLKRYTTFQQTYETNEFKNNTTATVNDANNNIVIKKHT